MTKEEYIQSTAAIDQIIKDAVSQRKELKARYIEEHAKLKIGDRVKITRKPYKAWELISGEESIIPELIKYAYVKSVSISHREGNIRYRFFKEKKNGTPSKLEEWGTNGIITKA